MIPYDVRLKNVWIDAITYQELAQKFDLIRAKRKVLFLDTAYSGVALR